MFKKLLALAAVATVCTSMNAKVVEDAYVDWTTTNWSKYVMGYIPTTNADEGLVMEWPNFNYVKVEDDGVNPNGYEIIKINNEDHYIVPCEDGALRDDWGIQNFFMNFSAEIGTAYSLTVYAKSAIPTNLSANCQWGWGSDQNVPGQTIALDEEWQEVTVDFAEVGGTGIDIILQLGAAYKGTPEAPNRVCIKWSKITHQETDGPVIETQWEDLLVNGDAEGEFGEVPCAYSKEYKGRGADGSETAEPKPCEITTIDGNKVFVVRAKAVDPNEYPDVFIDADGNVKGDPQWQNQFWIQSPQEWATDAQFRISFRYKADKPAAADTQAHKKTPGDYLHWELLGGINFTTEWQEFSKTVTVNASQNGMWSAAFNLKDYTDDNNYYFDDIKWEVMVLDEGWFAAAGATKGDIVENAAIELEDAGDGTYTCVVGDADNMVEWVKISTKRGDKQAFNNNTISVDSEQIVDDEDEFIDFVAKKAAAIQLPWAGQWQIIVDEEYGKASFKCLIGGVESVSVDNVAPVYYNLQGVKVLNPANGNIYIVKRGNKVSKEIVR